MNKTLAHYFDFLVGTSRIGRVRMIGYWAQVVVVTLIIFIALVIAPVLLNENSGIAGVFLFCIVVYILVILSLISRRLRDINWSPWLTLLMLVPLFNIIFFIGLLVVPGNKSVNNYGDLPPPNTIGIIIWAWLAPIIYIVIAIIFGGLSSAMRH